MLMLQSVMRPSIESERMADPAYSITCPVAPSVPMRPMMPRAMSLAVTAGEQCALDQNAKGFGAGLLQALGRQHMFHLRGADAEGQGA